MGKRIIVTTVEEFIIDDDISDNEALEKTKKAVYEGGWNYQLFRDNHWNHTEGGSTFEVSDA